jgi:hypothetical protein
MLAFGKHDDWRVMSYINIVMPALRAGIHGLLDHPRLSSKSWMLAFGKHDGERRRAPFFRFSVISGCEFRLVGLYRPRHE